MNIKMLLYLLFIVATLVGLYGCGIQLHPVDPKTEWLAKQRPSIIHQYINYSYNSLGEALEHDINR